MKFKTVKSKVIFFLSILSIFGILFSVESCQNDLTFSKTTININLDLSKIIKTARNENSQNNTEFVLKLFVYDAQNYKKGADIEKLPLVTQSVNKVDITGNVKASFEVQIGSKIILVAKLHSFINGKESEKSLYAGNSEVINVKPYGNKVNLTLRETHEHTFAKNYSYDTTHHWKTATCEHDVVSEKSEHSLGCWISNNDATTDSDGTKTRTCSICDYEETVIDEGSKIHNHTYSTDWTINATHHWKSSTCGHDVVSEFFEHNFTDWISNNDATSEYNGTKTRRCTVCGYSETVPSLTIELEISSIGETYTGTIPIKIYGDNLKNNEITSYDSFISNVNYISDTEATAEITCNNFMGSHHITINCGVAIGTAIYNVIESEKCFSVGDVLFTDGTRMKAEDVQYGIPDEQISKALGVIASISYGGVTGKAVGLQKSSRALQWAPIGTTGYDMYFSEIQSSYTSSNSNEYTFTGDLDGSDNWGEICKVDSIGSTDAEANYPAFNFAINYGTTAGLIDTGYENGWYLPCIAELYDVFSNRLVVEKSLSAVGGDVFESYYYFSSSQSILTNYICVLDFTYGNISPFYSGKDGNYSVLVLQVFNYEQFNNFYEVITTPNITTVEIERAGEGYKGDLKVVITGNNLKGYPVICSDSSFSNVQYISDTEITATITCDGITGNSYITVTIGSSNASGLLKFLSTDKLYQVGDIILTDGSKVSVDNISTYTIDELNKPIGIVASVLNGGVKGTIIGLLNSSNTLQWSPSGTTGFITNFSEIQGTTISGDIKDEDGSDNWDYVCSIDPSGIVNAMTNYPAFYFAFSYGTIAGLINTNYENSWYVPSVVELHKVYENKNIIQESLEVAGGFTIGSGSYWSSSQCNSTDDNCAYFVDFSRGFYLNYYSNKDAYMNVMVLRSFNAQ